MWTRFDFCNFKMQSVYRCWEVLLHVWGKKIKKLAYRLGLVLKFRIKFEFEN